MSYNKLKKSFIFVLAMFVLIAFTPVTISAKEFRPIKKTQYTFL